jgi:hypothetical protein
MYSFVIISMLFVSRFDNLDLKALVLYINMMYTNYIFHFKWTILDPRIVK